MKMLCSKEYYVLVNLLLLNGLISCIDSGQYEDLKDLFRWSNRFYMKNKICKITVAGISSQHLDDILKITDLKVRKLNILWTENRSGAQKKFIFDTLSHHNIQNHLKHLHILIKFSFYFDVIVNEWGNKFCFPNIEKLCFTWK